MQKYQLNPELQFRILPCLLTQSGRRLRTSVFGLPCLQQAGVFRLVFNQYLTNLNSLLTSAEVIGIIAAKSFIADIYSRIRNLDHMYLLHAPCRHLPTKNKTYRNIILGSYLVIFRITTEQVEVLRILHAHSSIRKIKSSRRIKP